MALVWTPCALYRIFCSPAKQLGYAPGARTSGVQILRVVRSSSRPWLWSNSVPVNLYSALATGVLFLHLGFILWVVLGAFLTRSRPLLRYVHLASLVWALLIEVLPWSCPLTLLENWLEIRAGVEPYHGGFLLHYLDALVYPDIDVSWLTAAGILVCLINGLWYAGLAFTQLRERRRRRSARASSQAHSGR